MNLIKKHIKYNYSVGRIITPKYIVIHETDNSSKGADAMAHFNYWNTNPNANTSTHFVVDSKQVVQMLELNERAWHVGDNKGHSNITNDNSIGIEICVNSDGDYDKTYNNAIKLVRYLLKTTNIKHIVRHKDASGKYCPRRIIDRELWNDFVNKCIVKDVEDKSIDIESVINQLYGITCGLNNYASTIKDNKMILDNIKGLQGVINYLKSKQ